MGIFNSDKKGSEKICPLIGKECIQGKCMFWVKLVGKHPQSNQDIDEWNCSISWLPVLMIENAQMTRQGTATVQQFRNEVHGAANMLAEESARRREIEERRMDVDERLLEVTKKTGLLESTKKEDEE